MATRFFNELKKFTGLTRSTDRSPVINQAAQRAKPTQQTKQSAQSGWIETGGAQSQATTAHTYQAQQKKKRQEQQAEWNRSARKRYGATRQFDQQANRANEYINSLSDADYESAQKRGMGQNPYRKNVFSGLNALEYERFSGQINPGNLDALDVLYGSGNKKLADETAKQIFSRAKWLGEQQEEIKDVRQIVIDNPNIMDAQDTAENYEKQLNEKGRELSRARTDARIGGIGGTGAQQKVRQLEEEIDSLKFLRDHSTYKTEWDDKRDRIAQYGQLTKNPDFNDMSLYIQNKPKGALNIKDMVIAGEPVSKASGMVDKNAKYEPYKFMSDSERQIYFYLQYKEGQKVADQYLDDIEEMLVNRQAVDLADIALENAFNSTAYSVSAGAQSNLKGWEQTLKRAFTGDTRTVDQTAVQKAHEIYYPQLEGGQKVGADIGHTIGFQIPNIIASTATAGLGAPAAVASLVGATSMGGATFGRTYAEERRRGVRDDKAAAYAGVNALLEGGLQYALGGIKGVSAGGVSKVFGKTFKGVAERLSNAPVVAQFFGRMAAQGGDEAVEEWLQAVLDPMVRNVMLDENNEIKPFSEDTLYEAALGFIVSAIMGAPSEVSGAAQSAADTSRIGRSYGNIDGSIEGLIASGLESDPNSQSYKLAQRMQDKVEKGKNPSRMQIGALAMANESEITNEKIKQLEAIRDGQTTVESLGDGVETLIDPASVDTVNEVLGTDLPPDATPADIYNVLRANQATPPAVAQPVEPSVKAPVSGNFLLANQANPPVVARENSAAPASQNIGQPVQEKAQPGTPAEKSENKVQKSGTVDTVRPEPAPVHNRLKEAVAEIREAAKMGAVENADISALMAAERAVAKYEQSLSEYEQKQGFKDKEQRQKYIRQWEKLLDKADKAAAVAAQKAKGNERLEKAINHYRDVRAREKTRQFERRERATLLRLARQMERISKRTGPEQKAQIRQLIGDIDTAAMSITKDNEIHLKEMRDQFERIAQESGVQIDKNIENTLNRLNQTQIADMDLADVQDMINLIRNLRHEIQTAKKEVGVERSRNIAELSSTAIKEVKAARGGKTVEAQGKVRDSIKNLYGVDLLSPDRMFARIGGWREGSVMEQMYHQLNEGQRKKYKFLQEAQKDFDAFVAQNKKLFSKWTGKNAEFVTVEMDGKKYRITPAQRIALYLHSLNHDSVRHMGYAVDIDGNPVEGGGLKLFNERAYKRGDMGNAIAQAETARPSAQDIDAIISNMPAAEKRFAEITHKFFNETTKSALNEASLELLGYELAHVENYFPIAVDKDFINGRVEGLKIDGSIEGQGFTKSRVRSKMPIVLEDATSVILRHMDGVSSYYGLAAPIRNFNRVLKATDKQHSGTLYGEIGKMFGKDAQKYIDKLLIDLQNTNIDNSMWNHLRGQFASAVIGFNPGSSLKQIASLPMASVELGSKPVARSMFGGAVSNDLIGKYSPLIWMRLQGMTNVELGDVAKTKGWADKVPFLMAWSQAMDIFTAKRTWKASEYYVDQHYKDLKRGTDAYYKKVAHHFERAVERTQSNYTIMQRPQILRSDNAITRSLTMFQTDRMQMYNTLVEAVARLDVAKKDAKANPTPENRARAKKQGQQMARTIAGVVGSAVTTTAITTAVDALLGRTWDYEDDEGNVTEESIVNGILKTFGGEMAGVVFLGGEFYDVISASMTGGKWYEIEAPNIAVINDLIGGVTGLGKAIAEFSTGISEISAEDGSVMEYASSNYSDVMKAVRDLSKSIGMIFGVPVANVEKYVTGIAGQLSPEFKAKYDNLFWPQDLKDLKDASKKDFDAVFGQVVANRMPDVVNDKKVMNEVKRLYADNKTVDGINNIFLGGVPVRVTSEKTEYILTEAEKQTFGKEQRKGIRESLQRLTSSAEYKKMTDAQKIEAMRVVSAAATERAKAALMKKRGAEYNPSASLKLTQAGGDISSYAAFKALTKEYGDEEIKVRDMAKILTEMDISEKDIQSIYAVAFEDKDTKPYKSIAYAVENGVAASTFAAFKAQDFEGEGSTQRKKQWLLDNTETQKELVTLYKIFVENSNLKPENTIDYALRHGMSAEDFIAGKEYVESHAAQIPQGEYEKFLSGAKNITGKKDKNGNTISGSKKAAMIEYVKTLNLNPAQRGILLMEQGYVLDKANYKNIAEYIAGLDLTMQEKLQLADSIGLVTTETSILYRKKK